jgi:hypothetical protein
MLVKLGSGSQNLTPVFRLFLVQAYDTAARAAGVFISLPVVPLPSDCPNLYADFAPVDMAAASGGGLMAPST